MVIIPADSDNESECSISSNEDVTLRLKTVNINCNCKSAVEDVNFQGHKVKGELSIKDLPPPENDPEFTLTDEDELLLFGSVENIVGLLVIVGAVENAPTLDVGSYLFAEDRSPLGQVHEVFGPVKSPLCSIRFLSVEDISKKKIANEMKVMYAPRFESATKYVFASQLRDACRPSDASWSNNHEPPPHQLDYSDDEQEKEARKQRKAAIVGAQKNQVQDEELEESFRIGRMELLKNSSNISNNSSSVTMSQSETENSTSQKSMNTRKNFNKSRTGRSIQNPSFTSPKHLSYSQYQAPNPRPSEHTNFQSPNGFNRPRYFNGYQNQARNMTNFNTFLNPFPPPRPLNVCEPNTFMPKESNGVLMTPRVVNDPSFTFSSPRFNTSIPINYNEFMQSSVNPAMSLSNFNYPQSINYQNSDSFRPPTNPYASYHPGLRPEMSIQSGPTPIFSVGYNPMFMNQFLRDRPPPQPTSAMPFDPKTFPPPVNQFIQPNRMPLGQYASRDQQPFMMRPPIRQPVLNGFHPIRPPLDPNQNHVRMQSSIHCHQRPPSTFFF